MNDNGSNDGDRWLPQPGDEPESPEQQELALKRDELRQLHDEVVQREMKCETLSAQVEGFAFARLYRLGPLFARVDQLQLLIEEALLAREPDDPIRQRRVQEARARAERSHEAAADAAEQGPPQRVRLTPELKNLYRKAARRMHPDLGRTPEDRELRHGFMVRLNIAYTSGDIDRVEELIDAWDEQRPPAEELSIGEELVRVIRAIARHRKTLVHLEQKIASLRRRPEHALMLQVHRAEAEEVDLLAKTEGELEERIAELEVRLRDMQDGA